MSEFTSPLNLLVLGTGIVILFITAINKNKWNLFLYFLLIVVLWFFSYLVFTPFFQALTQVIPSFFMYDEEDLVSSLKAPIFICFCLYGLIFILSISKLFNQENSGQSDYNYFGLICWASPFVAKLSLTGTLSNSAFLVLLFIVLYYFDQIFRIFKIEEGEKKSIGNPHEVALLLEDLVNKIERNEGRPWDNHFIRGNIFFQQERYTEAEQDFNAVIKSLEGAELDAEKKKYLEKSYLKLAIIKSNSSNWASAKDFFQKSKSYSINPESYLSKISNKLWFDVVPFNFSTLTTLFIIIFIWGYVQRENGDVEAPTNIWQKILQGEWIVEATLERENEKIVTRGDLTYDNEGHFVDNMIIEKYNNNWFSPIKEAYHKGKVAEGTRKGTYQLQIENESQGRWVETTTECTFEFDPSYSDHAINTNANELCQSYASCVYGYFTNDEIILLVKQLSSNKIVLTGYSKKNKGVLKIIIARKGGVNTILNLLNWL